MKRKNNRIVFLAVVIAASIFFNTVLVIQSVQYTYGQFVSDEAIQELEWVSHNLSSLGKPMIFAIYGNITIVADYIELWRRVIGSFIANSLIYVGRIDDLLLFREPRSNSAKLQWYAEQYWDELRTQVKYPENLTSIEVVILSYFYQPITKLEVDTRLVQLSDGVYIVNNYTAVNRLTLFGSFDYSLIEGPWHGLRKNWASSGIVLEINADANPEYYAKYDFNIDKIGNFTISTFAFDDKPTYVPVAIVMDNKQIMLINYSGTESPRMFSSEKILLTEGNHTIKLTPAGNGSLFLDLDYIEIDKVDN